MSHQERQRGKYIIWKSSNKIKLKICWVIYVNSSTWFLYFLFIQWDNILYHHLDHK